MKFPEEAKLSPEAKDLISKMLCNVDQRLGTKGADEIKVLDEVFFYFGVALNFELLINESTCWPGSFRLIHGSKALNGTNCIKSKLHLFLRSMMSWIPKTLRSLKR